jgi:hypothetical protein
MKTRPARGAGPRCAICAEIAKKHGGDRRSKSAIADMKQERADFDERRFSAGDLRRVVAAISGTAKSAIFGPGFHHTGLLSENVSVS